MYFYYVKVPFEKVKHDLEIKKNDTSNATKTSNHYIWSLVSSFALLFLARKCFMTSNALVFLLKSKSHIFFSTPLYSFEEYTTLHSDLKLVFFPINTSKRY